MVVTRTQSGVIDRKKYHGRDLNTKPVPLSPISTPPPSVFAEAQGAAPRKVRRTRPARSAPTSPVVARFGRRSSVVKNPARKASANKVSAKKAALKKGRTTRIVPEEATANDAPVNDAPVNDGPVQETPAQEPQFLCPISGRPTSPLGLDLSADGPIQKDMRLSFLPAAMSDICEGIDFFPGIAWGEEEKVGKSKIQRADREVEVWEEVKRAHEAGGLERLVPVIEGCIEEAKAKRAALDEGNEDDVRVGEKDPGKTAISDRLEALEWALKTSKYEPEAENIRGAIEAYKSGDIGYSDHFTILYAGKIVDTAPDYSSFVRDRQERLDRYAVAHGPHWLWYERPLKIHPETKPIMMMASAGLERRECWTSLGAYHIIQGYWKRAGWVNRMPQTVNTDPAAQDQLFSRLPDGRVYCQNDGPKQAFRSILDSGATYPSLYQEDLRKLMIDEANYAAQSVDMLNTANGVVTTRVFELFVCVLDNNSKQLVDPNNAAWPYHAKHLGGLCPVVEIVGGVYSDPNGIEQNMRLSGLLPFVACYISSTPTRNTLFLGEDRRDVLGSHRIPGQKKWDIGYPNGPPLSSLTWDRYGDPTTTFVHRNGQILDEDDPVLPHASTITFLKGTARELVIRSNPKEEIEAIRAQDMAEAAAKNETEEAQFAHENNPAWATGRAVTDEELAAATHINFPYF